MIFASVISFASLKFNIILNRVCHSFIRDAFWKVQRGVTFETIYPFNNVISQYITFNMAQNTHTKPFSPWTYPTTNTL